MQKFILISLLVSCLLNAQEFNSNSAPVFQKRKIKLGAEIINVEIADTYETMSYGLMFRTKLDENAGMLFIYKQEQELSFWMKNTLIPLSIGFFDKNKKLIDIQEMQEVKSIMQKPNTYKSKAPAMYALEMNRNWFSKKKISTGTKFSFQD